VNTSSHTRKGIKGKLGGKVVGLENAKGGGEGQNLHHLGLATLLLGLLFMPCHHYNRGKSQNNRRLAATGAILGKIPPNPDLVDDQRKTNVL
jgi:hypothetical protein